MNKKLLTAIILTISLIIIVLGIYLIFFNKQTENINTNVTIQEENLDNNQPTEEQTQEETISGEVIPPTKTDCVDELDTECWQTYRNTEYGFEFKFPAGWDINKYDSFENDPGNKSFAFSIPLDDPYYAPLAFFVNTSIEDSNIRDWWLKSHHLNSDYVIKFEPLDIVNSDDSVRFLSNGIFEYFILYDKKIISITAIDMSSDIEKQNQMTSKILSTFIII